MDDLLVALDQLEEHVGHAQSHGAALEILRDVWPDELEDLCERVELLKLLVWVCEGSVCSTTKRRGRAT